MLVNGSVLIHRSITSWEWYTDVPVRVLFEHLILTVNWRGGKFRGEQINRGERVYSLHSLEEETGLSVQQLRTAIGKLENTGEITRRKIGSKCVVFVNNFEKYQSINKKTTSEKAAEESDKTDFENSESTHEQHQSNMRATSEQQGDKESNISNKINNKNKPARTREDAAIREVLCGIQDEELKEMYFEFVAMREKIKSPMSPYALKLLIARVQKLEPFSIERQKELLSKSIINEWKSVYPLRDEERSLPNLGKAKTYDAQGRVREAIERTRRRMRG